MRRDFRLKLICIENEFDGYIFKDLVIGNIYEGNEFTDASMDYLYKIYNDTGDAEMIYNVHHKSLFLNLAEWRDKQINSIFDDENSLQENT